MPEEASPKRGCKVTIVLETKIVPEHWGSAPNASNGEAEDAVRKILEEEPDQIIMMLADAGFTSMGVQVYSLPWGDPESDPVGDIQRVVRDREIRSPER